MDWRILLIIFALISLADKALTAANITLYSKNFPNTDNFSDPYRIERNPVARSFFHKFGLLGGSVAYFFITIFTLAGAYGLFKTVFSETTSLYIIFLLYGLVIFNNLFFLLKYSRIIP